MFCASCHWYLPHTKSKKLHVFRSWFSRIFNSKRQVFPIPPSDTTHFSISYIGIDLIMIQYTSNYLIKFTAFWKNTHPKKHGTNLNPYLVGLQNTSTHWSLHPHWEKAPRQRWWVAWAFFSWGIFRKKTHSKSSSLNLSWTSSSLYISNYICIYLEPLAPRQANISAKWTLRFKYSILRELEDQWLNS